MNITKFGLQNFRVFKEHFEFELAPIMVLTGPNNSGKSSLSKALLLLKENEEVINYDLHSEKKLNYLLGEHNLGNHGYTINTKGENTVFSFTFFKDYSFRILIDNKSVFVCDTFIVNEKGEEVIFQNYGDVRINVVKIIEYLRERVKSYNKKKGDQINIKKIENLIKELKHFGSNIDIIDVNLCYPAYGADSFDPKEIKSKKLESEKKLKGRIYSPVWEEQDRDLNDVPYYGWENFIYIFEKITNIKLTKEEIIFLIPMAEGDFSSFNKITYINTIKEPIKRTYSTGDNLVFQSIISREIIEHRKDRGQTGNKIKVFANDSYKQNVEVENLKSKWLKEFGIGDELSYGYNKKTDTYFIKVDNKALPEYGLGYGLIIHILLALNKEINKNEYNGKTKSINFPTTFIIEEPETGLHPAFQSKIAEMIVDIQKKLKVNIIVETHSEYFIRKLQYLTAINEINPGDTVIYYFNNPKKIPEGEEQIKKITIEKDGSLTDNFGPGFIDEGTNLKFELLRLNKSRQN